MKIFLKLIFGIFLFSSVAIGAYATETETPETATITVEEKSLFGTISDIRKLDNQLSSMEVELKYSTENFINEAGKKISDKTTEKEQINAQMAQLDIDLQKQLSSPSSDLATPAEIRKEKTSLQERIIVLDREIVELQPEKEKFDAEHIVELEQKAQEIENIKLEIGKNKEVAKQQFYDLLKRVAIFASFILVAILVGKIVKNFIKKHGHELPQKRQTTLLKITNIFVISVITIIIFAVLFSQFATFLPFLALLGTGFTFAIRDVILSFIGWFFIGTKHGYRVGDIIEIDGSKGKVLEIYFIRTIIQEAGTKGMSGSILSIPNKKILEDEVKNFSKMYKLTWLNFEFLLDENSKIEKTKNILIEVITKLIKNDAEEVAKNLPSLSRKYGYSEDSVKPQVFFGLEERGVRVKVKCLCKLQNQHSLQSQIAEKFMEKIKGDKDVKLRFIE